MVPSRPEAGAREHARVLRAFVGLPRDDGAGTGMHEVQGARLEDSESSAPCRQVMRIAIFSRPYWPSVGGVELTTRLLACAIQECGHQPTVVTSTTLGQLRELTDGIPVIRDLTLRSSFR